MIYEVLHCTAPVRSTKPAARVINLFFSSSNFLFHKFNTTQFFFFFLTVISLTFLCTVPSTWKNKGGVQEKLGTELTFRVDKSLLLLQAFWEKKCFSFFLLPVHIQWVSCSYVSPADDADAWFIYSFLPNTATSYCIRVCVCAWWAGGCLWMMLLVFRGLESFSSHGFGGWTDSSWVDSLL